MLSFNSSLVGTGKSHVIASLVLQLLYRDKMYTKANRENGLVPRILLCAPSNTAVDVLVKRLLRKRGKMDRKFQHIFSLHFYQTSLSFDK